MKALNRQDDEFKMNLTPLLDVVFLLLVFFLVSTSFVRPEHAIDVDLPSADLAGPAPDDSLLITVTVKEDGLIVIDGRIMTGGQDLAQELQRRFSENPGAGLLIRGDRRAYHNDIVRVMNAALAAGLQDVMSISVFDTESGQSFGRETQ